MNKCVTSIGAAAILIVVMGSSCNAGKNGPPVMTSIAPSAQISTAADTSSSAQPTTGLAAKPDSELPFKAYLNTFPDRFLPGEEIKYGISIQNFSSSPITIDPYPPASKINLVGQDKAVFSSRAGTRTQVIEATPAWYHTIGSWDQKDNDGKQTPPGLYELSYEYVISEQNTAKVYTTNLTTRFQIVAPDSAANENLYLNQSVTAGGIAVTLDRIELTAVKGTVYVFFTPPGYSYSETRPPAQADSYFPNFRAEYRVDGGITRLQPSITHLYSIICVLLVYRRLGPSLQADNDGTKVSRGGMMRHIIVLLLAPLLLLGACATPAPTTAPTTNVGFSGNDIIDTNITASPLLDQAQGKLGFNRAIWSPDIIYLFGTAGFAEETTLQVKVYKGDQAADWWPNYLWAWVRSGKWQASVKAREFGTPYEIPRPGPGYSLRIWQKDNPGVQAQFSLDLSLAEPSPSITSSNPTTLAYNFAGTQWNLISINGHPLVSGSQISLNFDAAKAQGNGGCNVYGGGYTTRPFNLINFYEVTSTLLGCPEEISQQERNYLAVLQDTAFYQASGSSLEFYDIVNRQSTLVFQRN